MGVEGDENSKFFHGMINRKRANLAVKGVMIDGEWVDDPSKVKDEFRDYFASRFCDLEYIDFAKAYDSIRWDYLGDVLKSFGFGVKWCSWIRGILNSSMASILVNGSPTKEIVCLGSWSMVFASKVMEVVESQFLCSNRGLFLSGFGAFCLAINLVARCNALKSKGCSVAAKMSAPFVSSLRRDARGGEESAQLSRISDLLDTVVLSNMGDRRFWDLNGDGWVKQIPIKVNVLAWKISMDRLPTRVNLHRRGVQ
ncbi:hypothetical protein Tco_1554433, partial [Tanacetum coccineum]